MAVVAGVDFGTLSVRVSIVDSEKGPIGSATADYPLTRKKDDPDHATQRHQDHMYALVKATRKALEAAGVAGKDVLAIALDTTGSSVIPVDDQLQPLDDYYLWCDHRAKNEAAEITDAGPGRRPRSHRVVRRRVLLRMGLLQAAALAAQQSRTSAKSMATALEHCDMVAAVLWRNHRCRRGRAEHLRHGPQMDVERRSRRPPRRRVPCQSRSGCSPVFARSSADDTRTSDQIAGTLRTEWARETRPSRRASPFRSERSTRTGTRSAQASARATS